MTEYFPQKGVTRRTGKMPMYAKGSVPLFRANATTMYRMEFDRCHPSVRYTIS